MLYIVGGIVGGTIKVLLKHFSENPNDFMTFSIWLILLINITILFFRLKYKPLKYLILIIIATLLYLFDFILLSITTIDSTDIKKIYSVIAIEILSKSILLSLIIYFGMRQDKLKS
jgi:predicted ferric reductase